MCFGKPDFSLQQLACDTPGGDREVLDEDTVIHGGMRLALKVFRKTEGISGDISTNKKFTSCLSSRPVPPCSLLSPLSWLRLLSGSC